MSRVKRNFWIVFIVALLVFAGLYTYIGGVLNYLTAITFIALSVAFFRHMMKEGKEQKVE